MGESFCNERLYKFCVDMVLEKKIISFLHIKSDNSKIANIILSQCDILKYCWSKDERYIISQLVDY